MASFVTLDEEFSTPLLDELYPHLWLVARKSKDHIDALHMHRMKGRNIVISENPELHLTWSPHCVYVKPIPECLLFLDWQKHLGNEKLSKGDDAETPPSVPRSGYTTSEIMLNDDLVSENLLPMVAGFIRSYSYFIRHPSDFRMAQDAALLPKDWSWQQWHAFATPFRQLDNSGVAKRYFYGQLRLSRLNWIVRIYNPKNKKTRWFFHVPYWSIGQYLRAIIVPVAFIYTGLSLILAAMQLMVTRGDSEAPHTDSASDGLQGRDSEVEIVQHVFWIFGIIVLIVMTIAAVLFVGIPTIILIWQLQFGFRNRSKNNEDDIC